MLRVTTTEKDGTITLKLEGRLAGAWVEEFERCWRLAGSARQSPVVDLTGVTFVDAAGKRLLQQIYAQGARLVGTGVMTKSLIEDITGAIEQHTLPVGRTKGGMLKVILLLLLPPLCAGLSSRAQQEPPLQSGTGETPIDRGRLPALRSTRILRVPTEETPIRRDGLPASGESANPQAQEKTPLRLSLRGAVSLALKQNPQVQIANLNLAQSEQDHAIARSALLPQAGTEVLDRAMRFNINAEFGSKFPGIPEHAGPFQFFQAGPNFSMPVLDLTLWRRWQAAHQGVRASEAQQTQVREQIVLLVVSQYLGALRAGAAVSAARSRVELAQSLYDQAQDLQKHGVGTGIDTLRANVQLQNEKQGLIVAETQQRVALYGLARLLNLDPLEEIELTDEPRFFETPKLAASQSLEQALQTRPEVQALAARERMAHLERQAAGEERLPKIGVGGGWAYQGLSAPTVIPSYQYQVTVDIPLFTSGRIRSEIAKSDLELKKLAQERLELRNQISLEVKTAIAQLEAARNEVDVANLGVRLAQEEVGQARDRFQAGVANNIEVVSAQDALARANDNQIAALYRYNQSRADSAHAIGQMEALYAR
jgi:outer membrane protein TolC/anti-anti-sigma regulatory factor